MRTDQPHAGPDQRQVDASGGAGFGRGPLRFNALKREIGEISQKMLASTLRDLEENGFVTRTVTPVTPPQVEYALTDLGRDFSQPVQALADWTRANSPRIDAARTAYAARRAAR